MSFINLCVRSAYSMLSSTITIKAYIDYALARNMKVLSLVEDKTLHSTIKFYQACQNVGIKPIIGVTIDVKHNEASGTWTLFAMNEAGYRALLFITSLQADASYVEISEILTYQESLIICVAVETFADFKINPLPQNFYLSFNDVSGLKIAKEMNFSPDGFVFLNDVRTLTEDDIPTLRVLNAIKENIPLDNMGLLQESYILDAKTIGMYMESDPFLEIAMSKTQEIADKCLVSIDLKKNYLPKFPVDKGLSSRDYLEALCHFGVKKRYKDNLSQIHLDRLNYELEIITKMGFADYFLIVWDFIKYAKSQNILVGPGRGSAAGSLVSYVLGITGVDPVKYRLLFERFLNPDRISLPDIDIDFQDDRREEVINYVREKYGANIVCQIGTFGTFGTRSAWRDTARVHSLQTAQINSVTRFLTSRLSLEENLKQNEQLKLHLEHNPNLRIIYQVAMNIEGLPRHLSTHAAGIIIAPDDLKNYTAVTIGPNLTALSQFEGPDLETIGLLKMDFLGLRNLTMIAEITELIEKSTGVKFDIQNIPLDDELSFSMVRKAQTVGIFQLESAGMRQALLQVLPTNIEDIISVLALFRPGPMANIGMFAARKNKKTHIIYDDASLEPILDYTYGVIVYQEQIMQIVNTVAGYTLAEADILRRAISKKESEILDEHATTFIKRAEVRGYSNEVATKIFELIKKFASYGFNRSHAASYAMITYQMMYLKANYPLYFLLSVFNTELNNSRATVIAMKEARSLGIDLLPPSINLSGRGYTLEDNSIRLGFYSIKNIGHEIATKIITTRLSGRFKSFFDFVVRTDDFINDKILDNLILAGTFNSFGHSHETLRRNVHRIMDFKKYDGGLFQTTFVMEDFEVEELSIDLRMQNEMDIFGFYLTTHPMMRFDKLIKENGYLTPSELGFNDSGIKQVIGLVVSVREIKDKLGKLMAFIEIADETTNINVTIFSKNYHPDYKSLTGSIIVVSGVVGVRNEKIGLNFNHLVQVL